MIDRWLELTRGLNKVTQAMGRDDLYPFVLAPAVICKLASSTASCATPGRRPTAPPSATASLRPSVGAGCPLRF
jgi:hypothetical protein